MAIPLLNEPLLPFQCTLRWQNQIAIWIQEPKRGAHYSSICNRPLFLRPSLQPVTFLYHLICMLIILRIPSHFRIRLIIEIWKFALHTQRGQPRTKMSHSFLWFTTDFANPGTPRSLLRLYWFWFGVGTSPTNVPVVGKLFIHQTLRLSTKLAQFSTLASLLIIGLNP